MARSNGEAIRLIGQGGVSLDGKRVEDSDVEIRADRPVEHRIKVGKRRFVRVRFVRGGEND
jgi:tyrosyl-tRNA synthetase